jgi:hypothetical protein
MAKQCVIIVDQTKIVSELGLTFPVTVSVLTDLVLNSSLHLLSCDMCAYIYYEEFFHASLDLIQFLCLFITTSPQVEVLPPAILPVLRQLVALGGGDIFI